MTTADLEAIQHIARESGIDCELCYNGPLRARVNDVAPMCSTAEYVYLLTDEFGHLVYVGRSFRPADRLVKHRRKPWFRHVRGMAIIRVAEDAPWERPSVTQPGSNTVALESWAIANLNPACNIAGRIHTGGRAGE